MSNDNPIILPQPKVAMGNPDVIRVLEQALAAARAGSIAGVALSFAGGPGAVSLSMAGNCPAELVVGCTELVKRLTDNMFNQKRSPLLMPSRPM